MRDGDYLFPTGAPSGFLTRRRASVGHTAWMIVGTFVAGMLWATCCS